MGEAVQDFQADVIEASRDTPIVVDFWAEWCGPCRTLGPILEKLAREADGRWRLVKVNTEEHPEVAHAWNVRGIPAVKLFHEGRMIAEFTGALPEPQVVRWLDSFIPSESAKALGAAKECLAREAQDEARRWLERAIAQDASNSEARVLLAELRFDAEPEAAVELVRDMGPEEVGYDRAQGLIALYRLPDVLSREAERAHQSEDWRLYLEGIEALQEGRFAEALERWIEVMGRNRALDDDGARKACLALFGRLGEEHPVTRKYRRAFSSALF